MLAPARHDHGESAKADFVNGLISAAGSSPGSLLVSKFRFQNPAWATAARVIRARSTSTLRACS